MVHERGHHVDPALGDEVGRVLPGCRAFDELRHPRLFQSRADVDRPDENLVDAQVVEAEHRAADVGDGVGCSHLVEVHPLWVDAVDLRLRLGKAQEHVHRPPFDLLREAAGLDE